MLLNFLNSKYNCSSTRAKNSSLSGSKISFSFAKLDKQFSIVLYIVTWDQSSALHVLC